MTARRSAWRRRRGPVSACARGASTRRRRAARPVYGVNTGFGNFAETRIDKADLAALQLNLLRSHAAGVDEPLPVRAVRASMALRANVLAKGYSGIRVDTLEALLALLNRRVHPARAVAGFGRRQRRPRAVGASRAGAGRRRRNVGRRRARAGRPGVGGRRPDTGQLGPKEGLALINGTQVSTAVLALALAGAERLSRAADIAAALSIDGLMGSMSPFDARIHDARPFAGQGAAAANLLRLMDGSGDQRVPRQLRSRSRCLLDAVYAAGAWRGARSADLDPSCREHRDERGDRQPHGLRRRRTRCYREETFTARHWRWRPTCWSWRWRNWRRSASVARNAS